MLLQGRRENEFRGPLPAFLFLVIARGAVRPWRSSYNRVAHTRVHYLLDCFVSLAMTRECGRYSFHVIAREQCDRGDPVNAICVALRLHYLLDCFAMLAMTRGGLAMTRECGRYSFHVIAREQCDRGDPVNAICVALRLHYLLDCFAAPRMTRGGRDNKGEIAAIIYLNQNISCSDKSSQLGFIDSIILIFCAREPDFIFFSRSMASFIYWNVS